MKPSSFWRAALPVWIAIGCATGCAAEEASEDTAEGTGAATSAPKAGDKGTTLQVTTPLSLRREPSLENSDRLGLLHVGATVRWTPGPPESAFDHFEILELNKTNPGAWNHWNRKEREGWALRGCSGSTSEWTKGPERLVCRPESNTTWQRAADLGTLTDKPSSMRALDDHEPFPGPQWYTFKVKDAGSGGNPIIDVETDAGFPVNVFYKCDESASSSTCELGDAADDASLGAGCRAKDRKVSLRTSCSGIDDSGRAYVMLNTLEATTRYFNLVIRVR